MSSFELAGYILYQCVSCSMTLPEDTRIIFLISLPIFGHRGRSSRLEASSSSTICATTSNFSTPQNQENQQNQKKSTSLELKPSTTTQGSHPAPQATKKTSHSPAFHIKPQLTQHPLFQQGQRNRDQKASISKPHSPRRLASHNSLLACLQSCKSITAPPIKNLTRVSKTNPARSAEQSRASMSRAAFSISQYSCDHSERF